MKRRIATLTAAGLLLVAAMLVLAGTAAGQSPVGQAGNPFEQLAQRITALEARVTALESGGGGGGATRTVYTKAVSPEARDGDVEVFRYAYDNPWGGGEWDAAKYYIKFHLPGLTTADLPQIQAYYTPPADRYQQPGMYVVEASNQFPAGAMVAESRPDREILVRDGAGGLDVLVLHGWYYGPDPMDRVSIPLIAPGDDGLLHVSLVVVH